MRISRIFTQKPLPLTITNVNHSNEEIPFVIDDPLVINYLTKALRLKKNDKIILFDGNNGQWLTKLTDTNKRFINTLLIKWYPNDEPPKLKIHLGQCLSRGDRMDYVIQKATEMGVESITPLFSAQCEVKLNSERTVKKLEHWKKISISACEQCGRSRIPYINTPLSLPEWSSYSKDETKLVLHPEKDQKTFANFSPTKSISILIGPEAGLSVNEINKVKSLGFDCVKIGPRILRTETAPIAVMAVIQHLWGDW